MAEYGQAFEMGVEVYGESYFANQIDFDFTDVPLFLTENNLWNENLHADLLDEHHGYEYALKAEDEEITGNWTFLDAPEVNNWATNSNSVVTYGQMIALGTGYVPTTRQVIAGVGLTGGGSLISDVTLNVNLTATNYWTKTGSDLKYTLGKVGIGGDPAFDFHVRNGYSKTDTTERIFLDYSSNDSSAWFGYKHSIIGHASDNSQRRFYIQTHESGFSNSGGVHFQPYGGFVTIGGQTIGTEALNLWGNFKYSGTLKPGGVAGSNGYFLKTTGSADSWAAIAESDVTNLVSDLAAKQAMLSGTGLVKSTGGTISYLTDNTSNWNTAYGWGDPSLTYVPKTRTLQFQGTSGRITSSHSAIVDLSIDHGWTFDLAASGVSAGTGTKFVVDTYGRITSLVSATTVSAYGITDILAQTLAGYTTGSNSVLTSSNTILTGFQNLQAQITATALTGTGYVKSTGGTITYDSQATINYWAKTGSDLYYTAGKIGIGIVPNELFHVAYQYAKTDTTERIIARFSSNDTDPHNLYIGATGGASEAVRRFTFQTSEYNVGFAGVLRLQPSGGTIELGSGTGLVKATSGLVSYVTDNTSNWNAAYTASHAILTLGTANGLSLAGQALSLQAATTSLTGALTSTDWNTFNGKQSALSGTGYVKSTGGTISYDSQATINYWAKSGASVLTTDSVNIGGGHDTFWPLRITYANNKTHTGYYTNVYAFSSNDASNAHQFYVGGKGGATQADRSFLLQTWERDIAFGGTINFQYYGGSVVIGAWGGTSTYPLEVVGDISLSGALRFSGSAGSSGQFAKTSGSSTSWATISTSDISGMSSYQTVLSGSGIVKSASGTISYLTDNTSNWNTAYGWGNHAGLYSLLGHTHTASQITDFTTAARLTISGTGSISYNNSTGVISYSGGGGSGTVSGTGTAGYFTKWASGGANIQDTIVQDTGSEINFASSRDFGVEGHAAFRKELHIHEYLEIGKSGYHGTLLIFDTPGSAIDSKAALEIRSTTKGIMFCKMTCTQKTSISSPPLGLVVTQTDVGVTSVGSSGYGSNGTGISPYFFDGSTWQRML